MIKKKVETVAQGYLELLSLRGIDFFLGNAGTDFASIVDAFALRRSRGIELPRALTIPHEIPLVSMAHGYYLVTGKPQVAMVHVGVGTANGLGAIMAAHRARVPILFSAGRTPITESGNPASRSFYIHWSQESFDQAGMLREYVKWDYELRDSSQLEAAVDRALALSMTEPRGPVYLTLPRELLSQPLTEVTFEEKHRYDLPTFYPDPEKIQKAADLIAGARFPLLITSSIGRNPSSVKALIDLADAAGVGVVSFNPEYMNFPITHPCHQGFLHYRFLKEADIILSVDCDVPWYPQIAAPNDKAKIIQVGIDPFYSSYPIRSFPSDLTLHSDAGVTLTQLTETLLTHREYDKTVVENRREKLSNRHDKMLAQWRDRAQKASGSVPLNFQWVSYQISGVLNDETIVINEHNNIKKELICPNPGKYFSTPHAGYLGWGLGAALGVKLAAPDQVVIATVGDGSYMFGVPTACHSVSSAYQLPILIIVYNNRSYHAVKQATHHLHPDGWAVRTNQVPMSDLSPDAHYEKVCEAFGGYGERVEAPDQVGPALKRALYAVKHEKRQALLNMICASE